MNTQGLIDAVVQQTMVFIAQLATAGGLRTSLVGVADQVFMELTKELQNQGVRKKVIADMFGMALRTYHRRVHELSASRTEVGRTLWEVVLAFLRERESVSGREIQRRFRRDDPELLTGILNDLVNSGLIYRSGRGDGIVYRMVDEADFQDLEEEERRDANEYLVWLTVYRSGPVPIDRIVEMSRLSRTSCDTALTRLLEDGRIRAREKEGTGGQTEYQSENFQVPLGTTRGWEAAVLDHFQAMVTAIGAKLTRGNARSDAADATGGSTWSLDVWEGHPLEKEALGTLARVRSQVENLRERVDAYNAERARVAAKTRIVVYAGQYVRSEGPMTDDSLICNTEPQS